MAEIQPLKGWRYNSNLTVGIEDLTSPLFDVVSDKQRKKLYQNPLNSIHLNVPAGTDPAAAAARLLKQWKSEGILKQDPLPGIYVYYQYFTLPGANKEYCRKGFIANLRLHDWEERVILRHENTIPHSVNDRIALLEATQLNVSPTHGLFTDTTHTLERYLDEAIQAPLYVSEDYQGVRDVLAVIHDAAVIREFQRVLQPQPIILADGHHRFEGSLKYWQQMRTRPEHTGKEGYNFHLMYFTNTESDDLVILPTHRLVSGLTNTEAGPLLESLAEDFEIKPIDDLELIPEVIAGKPYAFGLILEDLAVKLRLKSDPLSNLWPFPDELKKLDLTVMHYFIIEKALGIPGKDHRRTDQLRFDRSFSDACLKVMKGEAQLALITNAVSIQQVRQVCLSGAVMPQKSTYFYPKVICGFVFSSIEESEFVLPDYHPFI